MIESLSEELFYQIADRVSKRLLAENLRLGPAHIGDLQSRYEEFGKKHTLMPGQLVRWKAGLKNRRIPDYGEAAIVLEVLMDPLYDSNTEADSPNFREPLDILIGLLDSDGDFLIYHYDKRRFEPMQESERGSV